jgi:hypothetical protein
MNTTVYHATPAVRSFAPGRAFPSLRDATAFAIEASERYRVPFVIWRFHAGVLRRLATYHPRERTSA